ncbi:MAG TPA: 50S ribosomal protein L10 [Gammaproteobacteria bacterium]|nr:50S ribosomal protein L10 [Gammaproteobacteria bacterium]HAU07254.1 50S ribosomal protein L10 [Gammaproteobacteria bacterium]
MALNLDGKKAVVAEVSEIASQAYSAIAAEYSGLSVSDMTSLRNAAREQNVAIRVVRNTLARRAVEGTDFACMQEGMVGQLVYGFSMEDPGAVARVMSQFSKEHDQFEVKMVALSGNLYAASEIDRLAKMPTKDQAIAILMGTMKAPVEKLVRTLVAPTSKMVRTLAAVRDAKEAA